MIALAVGMNHVTTFDSRLGGSSVTELSFSSSFPDANFKLTPAPPQLTTIDAIRISEGHKPETGNIFRYQITPIPSLFIELT